MQCTPLQRSGRRGFLGQVGLGAALSILGPATAQATLRIEVVGVGKTRVPVAVSAFEGDASADSALHQVLQQDFERSGLLRPVVHGVGPDRTSSPPSPDVADAWVRGSLQVLADGRLQVHWRLWDTLRGQQRHAQEVIAAPGDRRLAAHRIADTVQELLCGVRGVNATRIAYVVHEGPRHLLKVADADGANHRVALASAQPIISPAWAPDGRELAYVSFETGQAQVWAQEIASGRRRVLAAFRGSNSAPAWSPDGRQLALALSRDGVTQLFVMDRDGGAPRRVTHSGTIDTEPVWSPDGARLYFVSDRGGAPQIYRLALQGERVERVTFDAHSVSPAISPDGRHLAYVSRQEGAFRLMVKDLATGTTRALTESIEDERPSFAPNGRLLAYATREAGRDHLMTTTLDGTQRTRLLSTGLDVREPGWSPWMPDAPQPPPR